MVTVTRIRRTLCSGTESRDDRQRVPSHMWHEVRHRLILLTGSIHLRLVGTPLYPIWIKHTASVTLRRHETYPFTPNLCLDPPGDRPTPTNGPLSSIIGRTEFAVWNSTLHVFRPPA